MKKYKFEIYAFITCVIVAIIAFLTSCVSSKKLNTYTQIDTVYISHADTVILHHSDTSYVEKIINQVDTLKDIEIRTIVVNELGDTLKDKVIKIVSEKLKESNIQNSNKRNESNSIKAHEGIKNNSSTTNHEVKSLKKPWLSGLQLICLEIVIFIIFAAMIKNK